MHTQKQNSLSKPQTGHIVQFYRTDSQLLSAVSRFIGTGLRNGDTCIVVATSHHLQAIDATLKQKHNLQGKYIPLDSSETLNTFLVNGTINKDLFLKNIEIIMNQAIAFGKPVRVFGEMVALLWKAGNKTAVNELEKLWNETMKRYNFSLFCAYPELHFLWHNTERELIERQHTACLADTITS